jgi:hypothetical protein
VIKLALMALLSVAPLLSLQALAQQQQSAEKSLQSAVQQSPAPTVAGSKASGNVQCSESPARAASTSTKDAGIPECGGSTVELWCGGVKYCVYPGSNCCGAGFCGPGQRCEWVNGRQECRYN